MRTPPALVNRSATLASCLVIGLFSVFATGCDTKKSTATSELTPREAELTRTVEELRGKLAAAEQAIQQANEQLNARNAPAEQSPPVATTPAPGDSRSETPATNDSKPADTSYVVIKKTFTPGQLIPTTSANPNSMNRRAAECWITFKGAQSGKEYPKLQMKEIAYNQFLEGATYSAQALNQAKMPPSTEGATPSSSVNAGTSNQLSEKEALAIFGNPTS